MKDVNFPSSEAGWRVINEEWGKNPADMDLKRRGSFPVPVGPIPTMITTNACIYLLLTLSVYLNPTLDSPHNPPHIPRTFFPTYLPSWRGGWWSNNLWRLKAISTDNQTGPMSSYPQNKVAVFICLKNLPCLLCLSNSLPKLTTNCLITLVNNSNNTP